MFSYQALPFTHISEGCIWEQETRGCIWEELIDKVFISFFLYLSVQTFYSGVQSGACVDVQ